MSKNQLCEEITNKIIAKLEQGTGIFEMPFVNGLPKNRVTGKAYRGINLWLLDGGEYATFKQIKELGGKVKKGAKAHTVVFWKLLEGEEEETGKEIKIPLLKQYKVFKIGEQTEGIEPTEKVEKHQHEKIAEAEAIIKNYPNRPAITRASGKAYYRPSEDVVNIPPIEDFADVNRYYSTFFHELIHSTGSEKRLNREGVAKLDKFGSERYSKEELIAELGAAILCATTGIEKHTLDHSASYIQSWITVLKNDHTFIINGAQQAQKAVDHILNTTFE